jgi:hypothetical protein
MYAYPTPENKRNAVNILGSIFSEKLEMFLNVQYKKPNGIVKSEISDNMN